MNRKTIAAILLVFGLIFVGFFFALEQAKQNKKLAWQSLHLALPKFANRDFNATQIHLSDFVHNQCFLLNVWATWCKECLKEHNLLLELKQKNLPIIGLNYKDDLENAKFWLENQGNPFLLNLVEPDAFIGLAFDLGVTGAPETFLIDKNFYIKLRKIGNLTREDLNFLQTEIANCNKQ